MCVMIYTVCMSAENSGENEESLESIFKSVTGEEDCVITEKQEETPSHDHVDETTEEVTDAVRKNVDRDGLEDAVEKEVQNDSFTEF